jgi:replicative DNA helicase
LSAESDIDSHCLKTGNIAPSAFHRLAHAAGVLERLPVWVDDSGDLTLTMLRAKARRLKAQHDIAMIVVDYLQLMHGVEGAESRQQEISSISRGLKLMAKELDIAVIALSQLNRSLENRVDKRPQLSDLRESGAIEQDADVVCMLYRDEVYDKQSADVGIAECLVKKQRNGPIGEVRLGWDERTASFKNIA